MDLTKIDQPFRTLDIETKLALHRAHYEGKVIVEKIHISDHGVWIVTTGPAWYPDCIYRLRLEPMRDISLPWAELDARWKWAALDKNGAVYVYLECPDLGGNNWVTESSYLDITNLFAAFDPGNKPWNESLISRPSMVEVKP